MRRPPRTQPRSVLPARYRDALTGAPLVPGTLRLVVRSYDPTRPSTFDTDARRIVHDPIPYAIHNHRDERLEEPGITENRLGSFEFSGPFQRYMKDAIPTREQQRRTRWVRWYEARGVSDYLQSRFTPEQIDAVMAVKRGADWAETAEACGRSTGWLMRLEARMATIVRREFLIAA